MNAPQWSESSKSQGSAPGELLRRILYCRIENGVDVIPRCVRIAQYLCGWIYQMGPIRMRPMDVCGWFPNGRCAGIVGQIGNRMGKRVGPPPPAIHFRTFELIVPLYYFYKTYRMEVADWRSEVYPSTRITNERNIPSYYIDIDNELVCANLPESESAYTVCDIFR